MSAGSRFRLRTSVAVIACALLAVAASDSVSAALSVAQESFRKALAARAREAEKAGAAAVTGSSGWLFLASELRLVALDCFWGPAAAKLSTLSKPELSDPLPAILDFQSQLKQRGIELLLVPVPPKCAVYPEKIDPAANLAGADAAPALTEFYEQLRAAGVDVLDLSVLFREKRNDPHGAVFCQTDSHWSGWGCAVAGEAIAGKIRAKLHAHAAARTYDAQWKEIQIDGDLGALLPAGAPKPAPEKLQVQSVSESSGGAAVKPDADSPVLLMGDSHSLVYHDFFGERAGLLDQLALHLGFAPDLIGTRGSGATPVRISLFRRASKEPDYLAKKQVLVWCFTAREFADAAQGWPKVPLSK